MSDPSPPAPPRRPGRLPALLALLATLLIAVAPLAAGGYDAWYTARSGDTLTRVARLLGVKPEDLRRDNQGMTGLVRPGDRLRLAEPLRDLQERDLRWRRPLGGRPGAVLRGFGARAGASGGRVPHTGVDVAAPAGAPVFAPAIGVIRYCGPQEGFGTVVIIEHGAGWSTVLAPLQPDTNRCRPGEVVLPGDQLGRLGTPQEGKRPYLHIELRQARQAVRPTRLLH